jgi:diaminopimelate decarboxylase
MVPTSTFPGPHVVRDQQGLRLSGVSLLSLAKNHGTPLYVYDFDRIRERAREISAALHTVSPGSRAFYAVKALSHLAALKLIHSEGLGMDVVSGGEIQRSLAAGINAKDIVFSGVAKTRDEMTLGVTSGIGCFNVESPHEIDLLLDVMKHHDRSTNPAGKVNIALRINPDVDGQTHAKINTGLGDTKFGLSPNLAMTLAKKIMASNNFVLSGVSCHIGSQILDLEAIKQAALQVRMFATALLQLGAPLRHIDMGGGLGVAYRPAEWPMVPSLLEWVNVAKFSLPNADIDLHLEPGRTIVADSGVLLTQVIDVKSGKSKSFALVDAGMTELLRPALYDAYHHIESLETFSDRPVTSYDVVGPVCESSCWLGENVALPTVVAGDLLAVMTVGAYGMSMASNYNTRVRPAEIAIENKIPRLIRKQEVLSSLWESEHF